MKRLFKKSISCIIKERIEECGEKIWRVKDFSDLPFLAVAQTLSRLVREGFIQRLSKGIYYRSQQTSFGQSLPSPSDLLGMAHEQTPFYYAGVMAAHFLGFTTQVPKKGFVSTSAASLPKKLLGKNTSVISRRPFVWRDLSMKETAILEFIRAGGRDSELDPHEMIQKLKDMLQKDACYSNLIEVFPFEPPRVRAVLGALGEEMGASKDTLERLRKSLNPLSRFDFGVFDILEYAKVWQAKRKK